MYLAIRILKILTLDKLSAVLAHLASSGEATVSELMNPFALSQPAVSRHLKVLENAGLISRGRNAHCRPGWLEDYHRC